MEDNNKQDSTNELAKLNLILNTLKDVRDEIGDMQLVLCAMQSILKDFDARIKSVENDKSNK